MGLLNRRVHPSLSWLLLGIGLTPFCVALAVLSGGAGHGDYLAARLLFPCPMLLTMLTSNKIAGPSILFALAQFPAYGALAGSGRDAALVLLALHVIGVILAVGIPNFL